MNASAKKKNPLFVVTNNGQDVEEAVGFFDALVKKLGLEPVLEFLQMIFNILMENVGGLVALELFRGILDEFIDGLERLLKVIDPVLAFSFIKR